MADYDSDISEWSERQAALLRRRAAGDLANAAELDWPNIAEEIEDVGRSELHRVESLFLFGALGGVDTIGDGFRDRSKSTGSNAPGMHR